LNYMRGFVNYFGYDILYYEGDPDINSKIDKYQEKCGAMYKQ